MEKHDVVAHCQYFVKRKNRYCKMTIREGQEFCGEHKILNEDEGNEGLKRIVCPNDNKHTVYAHKLNQHLKICNSRKRVEPPYIVANINRGELDERTEHKTLSDLTPQELACLTKKVSLVYDKCVPPIRKEVLDHEILREELKNPEYGPKKLKHLVQNASLLRHAEIAGFFDDGTVFIEFGAGRGQVSYYVAQKMKDSQNCAMLLIDRANQKHKFDNKMKDFPIIEKQRIRADIADLCLSKINILEAAKRIVTVSKHLCGSATDYTLRCMIEHALPTYTGILISFCCHHRCDWGSYTGKKFMIEQGFTPEEFDVLCGLTSWAICGFGNSQDCSESPSTADGIKKLPTRWQNPCPSHITDNEKKLIGRKAKLIMNVGRQSYLEERGFTCELLEYVNETTSPENICILAKKENSRN
ncbi:hypothetical protein L9F63_019288 [Diploptera punctata]|uniref:tRNA:m(4)X modification enzyme TRM13 n=1 Tax=Diploptera punctata TaxID=6984 RepID=A0AAD7ZV17_DIPPU|nr:hypothetical protein L9F63_019288 [Diploptera punctata]